MAVPTHVLRLAVADFRNHALFQAEPGPARIVLLAGPNGAGKTNLLEALSLLSPGRGLRGARLADMARVGGPGAFRVAATVRTDPGVPPIVLHTFTEGRAPGRRVLDVNGAAAPLASLAQWFPVLWATPEMDRLFAGPASERRRFLDRLALALFPDHSRHATRYEAALRARARLLAGDRPWDPDWLASLEAEMALHGMALAEARRTTVARLAARLTAADDGRFPAPRLSLVGDAPTADWRARLEAARPADAAAGRATDAPHRVDLFACHPVSGLPAAQASTGEQKAMLISLLLAHAALVADLTRRVPLLLLDEAGAHLDATRRRALLDRLDALGGQAWLSATEARLFDPDRVALVPVGPPDAR
ncbi:MAG: DNA replication/repair protein RecF [Sphingomonadaceae bacterium]|uniref:DNA replication/repair protein RecF n=1 Tax=Thermaurantiacus sp. TaxID=2820283 RepID=UPI00298F2390|nr:DNA replication/repair protein RecF [Thermaurantiacus sp.]MCS6987179.1 DNA replication/repair protein RecF [Sphingomonadaceae bacterium]MDW8415787.1 DNA replication/repair protein RecF [Thermaurantiacus sp.]